MVKSTFEPFQPGSKSVISTSIYSAQSSELGSIQQMLAIISNFSY